MFARVTLFRPAGGLALLIGGLADDASLIRLTDFRRIYWQAVVAVMPVLSQV
jgi:hypothetical protein